MTDWGERLKAEGREVCAALQTELGNNLLSCCMYGSAIRGDAVQGRSSLNLFLLLAESDLATHAAVASTIHRSRHVDIFMVGAREFKPTVRAFASKFSSIRRHYELVSGTDVLSSITIDPNLERFLCEQALRNLRLRLGYNYIRRSSSAAYDRYLRKSVTTLFVHASEILRLSGIVVPAKHEDRIGLLSQTFAIPATTLSGLLELRQSTDLLTPSRQDEWHSRFLEVLDAIFHWIDKNWGNTTDAEAYRRE